MTSLPRCCLLAALVLLSFACSKGASGTPQDGGRGLSPDGGSPDAGTATPDGGWDGALDGGTPPAGLCADYNPKAKNLYWGDVHVHTSFSHDAFDYQTPSTPADAYGFAQGATIALSPLASGPRSTTIARKLDFVAVTDHAEQLDHSRYGGGSVSSSWSRSKAATAAAYDSAPSCRFTSLYGFEWSGTVSGNWYHRNVFFRSDQLPPTPLDAVTYPQPVNLWTALDAQCTAGCEVLTVPHNGNWSQNGILYSIPDAVTTAQAEQRAKYERVTEVYQHKGNSECKLGVNSSDPECEFEQQYMVDCVATPTSSRCSPGSYARNAIARGIQLQQEMGTNPLKLGLIGSTDTHNANPGDVDEFKYQGMSGTQDADINVRLTNPERVRQSSGGIVAVWSPENRREEIFDALKRREAYASSGPRIPLRFFGSWSLPGNLCAQSNLAELGYQNGVPMGGDLPARPAGATAPSFVLLAQKDNGPAGHPGVDLQYAQIIKVWYDPATHATKEQVFNVAGNSSNGATVDTNTCHATGAGVTTLCQVWTDPSFSATQAAAYYTRVFQNPTCTSRGYDCASLPATSRPASCSAATTRLFDRERIWSSPIWFTP